MAKNKGLPFWTGLVMVLLGTLQFINLGFISAFAGQIISKLAPLMMIIVGAYMLVKG